MNYIQLSLLEDMETAIERKTREMALDALKDAKLEEACRRSEYENCPLRIWAAVKWARDGKLALIGFLREEFGTGGHSMADGWFVDHNSSGFRITNLRGGERFYFTWAQVALKIGTMVGMERFLSEEDRVRMNRIIMDYGGEIPRPIAAYKYPYK